MWEFKNGSIKAVAVLAGSNILGIRNIELGGVSEHWKLKLHDRHGLVERASSDTANQTDLGISTIINPRVSQIIGSAQPQPDKVSLLDAVKSKS